MDRKFSSHEQSYYLNPNLNLNSRIKRIFLKGLFLILISAVFIPKVFADNAEPDYLLPEQAFKISAKQLDEKTANLTIEIAKGYSLYHEHFKFETLAGLPFQKENSPKLPTPITKKDDILGSYQIYNQKLEVVVPLSMAGENKGFRVQYQGCADEGFCYPPQNKRVVFSKNGAVTISDITQNSLPAKPLQSKHSDMDMPSSLDSENHAALSSAAVSSAALSTKGSSSPGSLHHESESDRISHLFQNKAFPLTLLAFLGLGVMLACTPCVLPMVPILANILVGQNAPLSKKRSLYLASLYVLSVSLCYALAGVAAGLLGSHLQATLQQPIFLIGLSFLLLLFALSQLNLVHVQLPAFFGNALQQLEQKQKHGSAIGAVAMGAISALMVSPCVTPALVGALTYIGQTGNAWLGGAALFALAFGMGLPLLIVACLGSHLLPKAGPWMKHIKSLTGVLLLVLAASVLMRAIPAITTSAEAHSSTPFITVHDKNELNQALASAQSLKKPVILDVYADWCISCKQMDKEVFENKDVLHQLSEVSLLRLDLTQMTQGIEQLQKELGIIGPPMVLFFGPDGQEVKSYRLAGKSGSSNFIVHLTQFLQQTHQGARH